MNDDNSDQLDLAGWDKPPAKVKPVQGQRGLFDELADGSVEARELARGQGMLWSPITEEPVGDGEDEK